MATFLGDQLNKKAGRPIVDTEVIELAAKRRKTLFKQRFNRLAFLTSEHRSEIVECFKKSAEFAMNSLKNRLGEEYASKVAEVIECHIERYDGTGPARKTADEIPLEAFVLNLAVTFRNMENGTPYRPEMRTREEVFNDLVRLADKQFPANLVVNALQILDDQRQAEIDDKMMHQAELGRVSSAILHDMDNYISELSARFYLITQECDKTFSDTDKIAKHCNDGIDTIDKLIDFRRDTLAFSRGETETATGDVHNTIDAAVELVRPKLGRLNILTEYDKTAPEVEYFPVGIKHVMWNILRNSLESIKTESGEIKVKTSVDEDYLTIAVSDNGEGMDAEHVNNIFSGRTTKANGNGIGTQFCKYIMDKHGGEIHYESRIGKGTTAYVKLPLQK
jgi:signal transduction histidine kinase